MNLFFEKSATWSTQNIGPKTMNQYRRPIYWWGGIEVVLGTVDMGSFTFTLIWICFPLRVQLNLWERCFVPISISIYQWVVVLLAFTRHYSTHLRTLEPSWDGQLPTAPHLLDALIHPPINFWKLCEKLWINTIDWCGFNYRRDAISSKIELALFQEPNEILF